MEPEKLHLETLLTSLQGKVEQILQGGALAEQIPGKADAETLRMILAQLQVMRTRLDAPRSDQEKPAYTRMITDLWWDEPNDPLGRELATALFELADLWKSAAKYTRRR